jgi:PleD family two-component response regulator
MTEARGDRSTTVHLGSGPLVNQSGPSSLLIVDEEEAVRDALSRRLERRGFRVTACPNG